MTISKTMDDVRVLLAAALNQAQAAKVHRPEDNPLAHLGVLDLVHGKGILKASDQTPALNMAAKLNTDEGIAVDLEQARRAGLQDGKLDKSAKRMAANRARAERKAQIDAIADSAVIPSAQRLEQAWAVVTPMAPIVDKIAKSKRAWASRFLGSIADDIGQMALEKMVLVLAKDDRDLTVLQRAAQELGGMVERTGALPGNQVVDKAERRARRQIAKGRKWLMGMANNRVMGALVDAYTSQRNLRWENIDLIATIMASINGVGDDPMAAASKAAKAPSMMGTRMRRPDGFDPNWLAEVISAAITSRGLDRMVEILLDDERRRTDGAFMWADNAEPIFLATPEPMLLGAGPSQTAKLTWTLLVQRTDKLADPRAARADAARAHVRELFAFLPSVIMGAVAAFEHRAVEYNFFPAKAARSGETATTMRAVVVSDFEHLVAATSGPREVLRPALTFATAQDAAAALTEYLAVLVTGKEVAASIAYA